MDIVDIFPDDPFEPTVQYAGSNQTPFVVPWAEGRVQLGAGLNTQRTLNDALFMERGAFRDALKTQLRYRESQTTSIKDESGTDIATSSSNTTFAISASVGGSFLGASGRGSFEKNLRDNNNTSNISVHAEHTCGQIDVLRMPRMSMEALRILRTSVDPANEFRRTYGDFYVAGFRVGAVNNTTISGQLANKAFFEAKRAELTVKVLFAKVHHSINEVTASSSDVGGLHVSAFDSLEAYHEEFTARTFEDSLLAGGIAAENRQRAMKIATRAAQLLDGEFLLNHEDVVCQDAIDRLCDRGLIIELQLAPFALLREYQSVLSLRGIGKG